MEKVFTIYMLKNNVNGKFYIGSTSQPVQNRLRAHFYEANKAKDPKTQCNKLNNAIRKYGEENFTYEILKVSTNEKENIADEINFIKEYNTIDFGYNLTSGGEGCSGGSEETFLKKSAWQKNVSKSEDHVKAIKEKANNRSKKHNEKLAESIRKRCKGVPWTDKQRQKNINSRSKIFSYDEIQLILNSKLTNQIIADEYDVGIARISFIKLNKMDRNAILAKIVKIRKFIIKFKR